MTLDLADHHPWLDTPNFWPDSLLLGSFLSFFLRQLCLTQPLNSPLLRSGQTSWTPLRPINSIMNRLSFWIPVMWVFIWNLSSRNSFNPLIGRNSSSCRITQHGPTPQPIMHRKPAHQPIMHRDASIIISFSDDRPSRPLVETWLLVRSDFTVETVALWTVIHCRQS